MAIAAPLQNVGAKEEPFYPDGDGKPMAESDVHWDATVDCADALRTFFAERSDVYVASDNFLYFVPGNPRAVVSPDCYVVFGVNSARRPSYKTWENGDQRPAVVIEITSKSTRREDTERKFATYRDMLAVPEYFLFDPTRDYLKEQLIGYRLTPNGYTRIAADARGRLPSVELRLSAYAEGERLRWYDPRHRRAIAIRHELRAQIAAAEQRADEAEALAQQEVQRAESAETELARLRAELAALRPTQP